MSGTHTLSVALFGVLRPGDRMVAVTGRPYDTLAGVIGIDAVSYTHLDVYKRQLKTLLMHLFTGAKITARGLSDSIHIRALIAL